MKSNHTFILVVVLFSAAAFIGGYLFRGFLKQADDVALKSVSPSPTATSAARTVSSTPTPKPHLYTVRLTASGVSTKSLTIRKGDAVTFVNDTSAGFWPASNPHPIHTGCPGFDALRSLGRGEEYTLVFAVVRTCGYHNHVDPLNTSQQGTIIVQ